MKGPATMTTGAPMSGGAPTNSDAPRMHGARLRS